MPPTTSDSSRKARLLITASACGLFLLFQLLLVHGLWKGDWTALYRTGNLDVVEPCLPAGTHIFQDVAGYDGQFYRLIARDPLELGDTGRCIDDSRLRYRRILIPALAWALAAGQSGWIDGAYMAVLLGFAAAGVWWGCRIARHYQRSAAWGLAFLAVPATLISVDRLTIDIALGALCLGFVWYSLTARPWPLWAVVAAACLVRETGLLLVAAVCLVALLQRNWRRMTAFSAAALPTFAWYLYVHSTIVSTTGGGIQTGVPSWVGKAPLTGILRTVLSPPDYPGYSSALGLVFQNLDRLVLLGTLLSIWFAVSRWPRQKDLDEWRAAAMLSAAIPLIASAPAVWVDVNGYARFLTPTWLLVGLRSAPEGRWIYFLPILFADLRLAVQLVPEFLGALRGLAS